MSERRAKVNSIREKSKTYAVSPLGRVARRGRPHIQMPLVQRATVGPTSKPPSWSNRKLTSDDLHRLVAEMVVVRPS